MMLRGMRRILQKPCSSLGQRDFLTVIMGPPGGGKGTISKRLVRDFDYLHISTGDVLRAHVRNGTELGEKVKEIMNKGGLVSDDLVINMLNAKLKEVGKDSYVLLDGFPRTEEQAKALDSIAKVDRVLYLDVPFVEIVGRAADRWVHPGSGRTYSAAYSPPKIEGIDDETGEPLVQREDDKPEAVFKRLDAYAEMTFPLRRYYSEKKVLSEFSGDNAPDLVKKDRRSDAIYQALKPLLESKHEESKNKVTETYSLDEGAASNQASTSMV